MPATLHELEHLVLFVVTEAILSLTPGPAVLLVVSSALRGGVRSGVSASLGILAANAMYFAISATSLGAVLAASVGLYIAVKWIGSAYLVYLGFGDLLRPSVTLDGGSWQTSQGGPSSMASCCSPPTRKPSSSLSLCCPSFLTGSIPFQVLILGASSIVVEFAILLGYSSLAGKASTLGASPGIPR